ncbi:MAG: phosphoribosylanthranilate isomerase [bacterium]|nr:phosphoribosylanthranilate isomerase [bacterium]
MIEWSDQNNRLSNVSPRRENARNMNCKIKICGLTNRDDMELVAAEGADYGGILIDIDSPRGVRFVDAMGLCEGAPLPVAAVTLNKSAEDNLRVGETLQPAALQLHGDESAETTAFLKERLSCEIWKVIHLPAHDSGETSNIELTRMEIEQFAGAGVDRIVLDAAVIQNGAVKLGGTGKTIDWWAARVLREATRLPLILAGGLNERNAADAVIAVEPYGIDLSSGVEREKGKKDPEKVKALIARVREL